MRFSLPNIFIIIFLVSISQVYAWDIKVVDSRGIDATNIKSLVGSVTKDCTTDQQKMEALWAFITRNPFYHWCEAREGREVTGEFGIVYDPVKAFNVYGTVICYQVADLLANMAQEAGIRARTRSFPYKHKVMEAFYDGSWHLFDAQYDCQAIYYKADGKTVASLNEVDADPQYYLIDQPNPSDPFYQFDYCNGIYWPWESKEWVKENWYDYFETKELEQYLPFDQQGHRIIISLKPGEKLVRYWDNQGKWFCDAKMRKGWSHDLTQKWVGLGPHDPRNPFNTYANGVLIYKPDWRASKDNFYGGLHKGSGYALEDGKVCLADDGKPASVTFRVSSPYLLAGHPNRLFQDGDSKDGAIFKAIFSRANESSQAVVSVSLDEGLSWEKVWQDTLSGAHPVELDLTNQVEGHYSYLVRVDLNAPAKKDVWLSDLELENSLFYSPVLLPSVQEGENTFSVDLAEPSEQYCLYPDLSSREALEPFCQSIDNLEYNEKFNNRLVPPEGEWGSLSAVIDPVGGSLIHSFTVYGSFGIDPQAEAVDSIEVLYAENRPDNWKSAWIFSTDELHRKWDSGYSKEGVAALAEHWRLDKSLELEPSSPAEKIYVQFRLKRQSRVSLNDFKVYAYYEPERDLKPALSDLVITQEWQEGDSLCTNVFSPASFTDSYKISASDSLITNQSITYEMKNRGEL